MTTDDGDVDVLWVLAGQAGDKGRGSADVEGRHTKQTLRVVHTRLLVHLGADRDRRVDWVGDDGEVGLWAVLSASLGEVSDDGGVGLRVGVLGGGGGGSRKEWTSTGGMVLLIQYGWLG